MDHLAIFINLRIAQGNQEPKSISQRIERRGIEVLARIAHAESATSALLAGGHGTVFVKINDGRTLTRQGGVAL